MSHTHQNLVVSTEIKQNGCNTVTLLLGETLGPVSYTHLDVYKRQPQDSRVVCKTCQTKHYYRFTSCFSSLPSMFRTTFINKVKLGRMCHRSLHKTAHLQQQNFFTQRPRLQ